MDSMQPSKGQKAIIDSLGLGKPLRWIAPWAGFVLAVLVGRIFAKESLVDTGVFIVGMPPAWLAGWMLEKRPNISLVLVALLIVAGLAVGFFVEP